MKVEHQLSHQVHEIDGRVKTLEGIMLCNGAPIASHASLDDDFVQRTFDPQGADFAEWMPRDPNEESFPPGTVVAVNSEALLTSKVARGEGAFVISQRPTITGNQPVSERSENGNIVAFIGQVTVRTSGPVKHGDHLVPSGNNDGKATAQTSDQDCCFGVVWEVLDSTSVRAFVGPSQKVSIASAQVHKVRLDYVIFHAGHLDSVVTESEVQKVRVLADRHQVYK